MSNVILNNGPSSAELEAIERDERKPKPNWASFNSLKGYVRRLLAEGKYDDNTICEAFDVSETELASVRAEVESTARERSQLHPGLQQALNYLEAKEWPVRQPVIRKRMNAQTEE